MNTSQLLGRYEILLPDGSIWQQAELEPGRYLAVPMPASSSPTHLRFQSEHPWLKASVRYSGEGMMNHPLVAASEKPAQIHRYALNFTQPLWHGLALVNAGSEQTEVTFRQYSRFGELLTEVLLHDHLEVGEKLLASLSMLSMGSGKSLVEIHSSQVLAAVVLEGNYAGEEVPGFISVVSPLAQRNESISLVIVAGLDGSETSYTILDGQLAKVIDGDLPSEEIFVPMANYAQVLSDLEEMGIFNLEVESDGTVCCDNSTYSLSIIAGKGSHSLFFHDGDLSMERPGALEANALVDYIRALAEP